MPYKINPTKKKIAILSALGVPRDRKEIGRIVGFYKLNTLMAELNASGLIAYNQSTRKFERVNVELVIL